MFVSRLDKISYPIYNIKGKVLISAWNILFLQLNIAIPIMNFYLIPAYLIGECNVVIGVTINSHDEW